MKFTKTVVGDEVRFKAEADYRRGGWREVVESAVVWFLLIAVAAVLLSIG